MSFINDSVRTVSYRDAFPVVKVTDGRVAIGRRGEITVGWELTLPPVHTSSEEDYDEMTSASISAVSHLPGWCMVHRQDIYTYGTYHADPEERSYLGRSYEEHYDGRRYLRHRAYVFVTKAPRSIFESNSTGIFGVKPKIDVMSEDDFQNFLGKCESFIGTYCSRNVSHRQLTADDWLGSGNGYGIVDRYMSMGNESCVGSDIALGRACVGTSRSTAVCYCINSAEQFPGVINSVVFDNTVYGGENNTIYTSFGATTGPLLSCEHAVNQYMLVLDQAALKSELAKKRRRMKGGRDSSDNFMNKENIDRFLDMAYDSGMSGMRSAMNIVAWDTPDRIDALSNVLDSVINRNSVEASRNLRNTHNVWYAGIPGAAAGIGKENMLTGELESLMCLSNWDSFNTDTTGGLLKMSDRLTHVPVRMDIQDIAIEKGWIGNMNVACLGGSGTGKSFFVNSLVNRFYDAGEHVFIIDVGDSYEGQCGIHAEESGGRDGQYHTWDDNRRLSFNPFIGIDGWLNADGTLKTDDMNVNFFLSLIQAIWSPDDGWKGETTPILVQFIRDFVQQWLEKASGTLPVFNDFFRYIGEVIQPRIIPVYDEKGQVQSLPQNPYVVAFNPVTPADIDIKKFLRAMAAYAEGGSYAYLLNNPQPSDLSDSRFSVYEVAKVSETNDKKFYSVVVLCIINIFNRKMRSDKFKDVKKVMVIEEAWKAIANESMEPYIKELWKTSRKYSTTAMVVTQEVEDILGSDIIKNTILKNSDVKILLDQSNNLNCFDDVQELFGLSEKDRNIIFSMNKGKDENDPSKDVFIKFVKEGAAKTGVFRTEVSLKQAIAYESKFEKKRPFIELAKKIGYIEACEEIYRQKTKKVAS